MNTTHEIHAMDMTDVEIRILARYLDLNDPKSQNYHPAKAAEMLQAGYEGVNINQHYEAALARLRAAKEK